MNIFRKKKKCYVMSCDIEDLEENIDVLAGYKFEDLGDAKICYRVTDHSSKAMPNGVTDKQFEVFYLLKDKYINSFNLEVENKQIHKLAEQVNKYFKNTHNTCRFIRCVFMFIHDNISPIEEQFYNKFLGFEDDDFDLKRNDFNSEKSYFYCGVNRLNKHVYFSFKTELCEYNYDYMIEKDLKAVKVEK